MSSVNGALFFACVFGGLSIACGGSDESDVGTDPEPQDPSESPPDSTGTVDASPELPSVPEGAVRIELPEQTYAPGEERQNCVYMDPLEEDRYMVSFEPYQGEQGHHLLLFRAVEAKPVGTVEDCTEPASMANLIPTVFASNVGIAEFPEGMAIRIPAGSQIVVQQHYVNTSTNAIRVRDAADLFYVDAATVETPLGYYTLTDVQFVLPPAVTQTVVIDCEVPRDMNLLMAGPHMHEYGDSLRVFVDEGSGPSEVFSVPEWEDEFRDLPPLGDFTDAPMALTAGSRLRLECDMTNTTSSDLTFPAEMCALYGYYYPGDELDTWICLPP